MADFGFSLLCLACFLAFMQALLPWIVNRNAMSMTQMPLRHIKLSTLQLLALIGSFSCLIILRIRDDFSVSNVAEHSNLALPLLYKITGTWGNHEGSMLLWVLILAIDSWVLAVAGRRFISKDAAETMPIISTALSVQAALSFGFLLFIIMTSNPFAHQFPVPLDGNALNPLLQDIGLAIHPPMLYLGYVGFSLVFSLAVAALIHGRMTASWSRLTKPFMMVAWSTLTLGIGLGSWWAYRELGWGGWWFWDPVENASLLPWLAGTALLHCNIAHEKRGVFKPWIILLAIFTFALSLLGTFLVRSGVLTSVHSFASDPERGFYILGYMVLSIGGALLLYGIKIPQIAKAERAELASREGLILINNLFLLTVCLTILFGTLYPLLAEWWSGRKVTVGAPYFNMTTLPLMVIPVLLAGIAPLLPWKGGSIVPVKKRLLPALSTAVIAGGVVAAFAAKEALLSALGFGLAAWLIYLSVATLLRNKRSIENVRMTDMAVFFAHIGVAIFIIGITAEGLWATHAEAEIRVGESLSIGQYSLFIESQQLYRTDNFMAKRANVSVRGTAGNHMDWLYPEFRFYPISGSTTSEATIISRPWADIYVVIGQSHSPDTVAIRAYIKPLMQAIWAGFLLMAMGGFLSIASRFKRRPIE